MRTHAFSLFTALGLGVALLSGCGGGGGGGGSAPKTVNYTGPTTPAIIADTNTANTLTHGAINGGNAGSVALGSSVNGPSINPEPQEELSVPKLAEVLTGFTGIAKPEVPTTASSVISRTVNGACGGTASLSGTDNSTPGHVDVHGTIAFSGYCSNAADNTNVILNGTVTFTMLGTSSSYAFTMNSAFLSATVGGQAYAYSLSYSCTITGNVAGMVTLTATYQTPDGKVYRIENYQVNLHVYPSYNTLTIQGRFYHPDYGYVDVSTPVVLTYTQCTNRYLPTSGTLQVTGANGYAQFIAVDCSKYQVCLTNGTTTCVDFPW